MKKLFKVMVIIGILCSIGNIVFSIINCNPDAAGAWCANTISMSGLLIGYYLIEE